MNYKRLLIFALSLFNLHLYAMRINEALQKKVISATILVNEKSTHYANPFFVELKNSTNTTQQLEIANGLLLIADDSEFQNFIVTEQKMLALKPFESLKIALKAMCIEQNDRAPLLTAHYTFGEIATEPLRKLSIFIEKNQFQEPNAQFLMWDLANGKYKPDQIDDFEIDVERTVWVVDSNEKGERKVLKDEYQEPIYTRELKVSGEFTMELMRPKKVHIAMFTMQNVLVKELYNNPVTPRGISEVKYAFNSLEFTEEKYQIKLVVDGEIVMNRVVVMDI